MSNDPVGPGEPPEECVVPDEEADDDWSPHDELHDAFKPGPIKKIIAADGLPAPVVDATQSDIPALSLETLVCMGDFSAFVERDENGIEEQRHEPKDVKRYPSGQWYVEVELQMAGYVETQQYPVEPIRPPCKHYARQLTQFSANPENQKMLRLCTARRDTAGAFMAVDDLAMWACDLREPRHVQSESLMTAFDDKKIKQGKERELLPMFEGFGIFDAKKSEKKEGE
jgi:hypothetical protein